jgi:CHASE2 domain-containing sensor protein
MDPRARQLLYRIRRDWQTTAPAVKRFLFATIAGCLAVVLTSKGITDASETTLLEHWFWLRGTRPAPTSVTVVRLDKPAYDVVGTPLGDLYPRRYLAEGIEKIAVAGAKMVLLDAVLQRKGEHPEGDKLLAKALAGSPSVIGRFTQELVDIDAQGKKQRRRMLVPPLSVFAESAKMVIPLELRLVNGVAREMSLSNERDLLSDVRVPLLAPLRRFVSPEISQPGGFDFINFYGGPFTLSSMSFAALLDDSEPVDENYFKDRVVLIGVTSDAGVGIEAGKDTFLTSVSKTPMYGVEIHATIAANLIDGTWIRRLPRELEALTSGLLALAVAYAVVATGPSRALFVAVGVSIVWLGVSYFAFSTVHYLLPGRTLVLWIIPGIVLCRWAALAGGRRD